MKTGIVGNFDGYPVYATTYWVDKEQARKHKKKRINKKWLKRYGVRAVPRKDLFLFDGKIYGHPTVISKLIEEAKIQQLPSDILLRQIL